MSERDPRVDPRPGDKVGDRHVVSRCSYERSQDGIGYRTPEGFRWTTPLSRWQTWAKNLEVLKHAD